MRDRAVHPPRARALDRRAMTWAIRLALFLAGTVVGTLCPAAAAEEPVEPTIQTILDDSRCPGAVVGVYRGDDTLLEVALGQADVERGVPMRTDLTFRIGSLTKPMLGVVVLQLVDEGRLSLDEKLARYRPDFPCADAISLGDLGTMTACIRDPLNSLEFKKLAQQDPLRNWTRAELLDWTARGKPWPGEIGRVWNYSNASAMLLADVVEQVTGNAVSAEIQKRVVEPLGLARTRYDLGAELPAPFARGYSYAPQGRHLSRGGDKRHDVTAINPSIWNAAGAMSSTLADVRTLARAIGRGTLVSPASFRTQTSWRASTWKNFEYGFLLGRVNRTIGHDGDVPGYQCFMGYRPQDDLTIVVLTNLYGWSVNRMTANTIAEKVLEHLDKYATSPQR